MQGLRRDLRGHRGPGPAAASRPIAARCALVAGLVVVLLMCESSGGTVGPPRRPLRASSASAQDVSAVLDHRSPWHGSDAVRVSAARAAQRLGRDQQPFLLLAVLIAVLAGGVPAIGQGQAGRWPSPGQALARGRPARAPPAF